MNSKYLLTSTIVAIACTSGVGCGAADTRGDAGVLNDNGTPGYPCPFCLNPYVFLPLGVTSSIDGGTISGVGENVDFVSQVGLSCQPYSETVTSCWLSGISSPGNYAVSLTAPGFRAATFNLTLTETADSDCGCHSVTITPSTVSLDPEVPVDVRPMYGASVPACAAGYEHPNICCRGAAYEATTCTEDPKNPFGPCPSGQFAYPDPKACCDLNSADKCVAGAIADVADAGDSNSCINPCAPGAYPDSQDPAICRYGVEGVQNRTTEILYGVGTVGGPPQEYCATPCPQGWGRAFEQNDVCCQQSGNGWTLCYSQASYISGLSGGTGRVDGASFLGESFFDDGNSYVMKCDFTASSCQCLFNGNVVATPSASEFDVNLLGLCPFPVTQ